MAIDVEKVAHLARLTIDAKTRASVSDKLEQIKILVEHINAVDTTEVAPMAHPFDQQQRLRADEVTETDQRQILQRVAPQIEAGLYLVPKVIERG